MTGSVPQMTLGTALSLPEGKQCQSPEETLTGMNFSSVRFVEGACGAAFRQRQSKAQREELRV